MVRQCRQAHRDQTCLRDLRKAVHTEDTVAALPQETCAHSLSIIMGKDTDVHWADSTLNLQMGCKGCELWNAETRICYAGLQTQNRAGFKGWPKSFGEPQLFLDRLSPALKWADLTGSDREDKPWLNGMPRLIFLNDMGDTFTEGLPKNWLAPFLALMSYSPHQFLLLTKRPSKMLEFSQEHEFPPNFWLGVTVTSNKTLARVELLRKIAHAGPKFVSVEPIWEDIDRDAYADIDWAIFGGESGKFPTKTNLAWLLHGIERSRAYGCRPFVKQLGADCYFEAPINGAITRIPFPTADSHGGDAGEFPECLNVREMPVLTNTGRLL